MPIFPDGGVTAAINHTSVEKSTFLSIYMEKNLLTELTAEPPQTVEKMITDVEKLGEMGLPTAGKIADLLKRLASMPVNSVAIVEGPIKCPSAIYGKGV